ncbi:MAG: hypothetical protein KGZ34_07150 [Nitrosarchaeum sp.]|nr:hypothetical protein [Nitrosarchaeum sp.]
MAIENESSNETKSKIYVLSIQILFGIIIGISFIDYHKTLVPFNPNIETLMIFVTYATVLMSLIGYSIAVTHRFHKNFSRFAIDIFLLYLYYQLVYSLQTSFDYFLWIFPIIFGSYVVWQILEYYEWKDDDKPYKKKEYKWVLIGTIIFTIAFFLLALFYNGTIVVEDRTDGVLHYLDESIIEWGILSILVALVFGFRIFFYCVQKYKT